MRYTEGYRRGHNENDSKSFDGQKPSVGSNPTPSASEKPSHIKALRPYDWAFLFANLPLLHMIFGKKSCLPSDGLGFRQGQDIVHDVCGRKLGLIIQVAVDVCRGADIAVAQPFLDLLHGHVVGKQQLCPYGIITTNRKSPVYQGFSVIWQGFSSFSKPKNRAAK